MFSDEYAPILLLLVKLATVLGLIYKNILISEVD